MTVASKGHPPTPRPRWVKGLALAVALGCVALQIGRQIELAAIAVVIWLTTVWLVDRHALRRMKMPKFWTIMIIVALGSGLLLGPRDIEVLGLRLSAQGLEAGALMVLRGVFIFALTSWASRAVEGTAVKRIARRVGLGNLGVAVASAFGVLPALIDGLAKRRSTASPTLRERLGSFRRIVVDALIEAVHLAKRLAPDFQGEVRRARFVAVVGPPGAGKTTAVNALVDALVAKELTVGGVLQPPLEDEDGLRSGYDLRDLSRGTQRPFARRRATERGFDFEKDGWSWAADRLAEAKAKCDVVIVDELGRLEARGEGHLPSLAAMAESPGQAAVLIGTVRQECVESMRSTLGNPALNLQAPLEPEEVEKAAQMLADMVKEAREGVRLDRG